MEDFNKKLEQLKSAVINEIKSILPEGKTHVYNEQFYCTMIDGESSPVSVAVSIKNDGGKIILHDHYETEVHNEEFDTELVSFEIQTIIMAYETLRKELRAQKIERIKQLVEQAGGTVKLDSTFTVRHYINEKWIETTLQSIEIGNNDKNGKIVDCLWFDCFHNGETHEETDSDFPDNELDSLLAYIERETGNLDISLTDEQKEVLDEFNAAWIKLKESKVAIILDIDYREFHFCNGNGLKFSTDWDGCPQGFVSVQEQLDKMPTMSLHDECYYPDNNEEVVAKKI